MLRRVAAIVLATLGVLVCAGGSNASSGVTSPVAAGVEVGESHGVVGFGYNQSPDLPSVARIVVRVPEGFTFTPSANGAPVGSVVGSDVFFSSADPRQPLTGALTIADPVGFGAEGKACTGSSTHDAVWAASAGAAGATPVSIPVFVDGRTFTLCPDPRRLGGTPIGIAFQFGRPLVTAPSSPGRFVWSATVTWPGQADAELINVVNLPQRASFRAKVVHSRLRITGRVVADGRGITKVRLAAFVTGEGRRLIIEGHSRADGRFTLSHRLGHGTFFARVDAYAEQRNVTTHECAGGSCASANETILGMQAAPGTIHVRSPGRR
jgi:hypothetical protein